MHRTSVDDGIVLDGEIALVLGNSEVSVRAGDVRCSALPITPGVIVR